MSCQDTKLVDLQQVQLVVQAIKVPDLKLTTIKEYLTQVKQDKTQQNRNQISRERPDTTQAIINSLIQPAT